jgi:hypothetical protein
MAPFRDNTDRVCRHAETTEINQLWINMIANTLIGSPYRGQNYSDWSTPITNLTREASDGMYLLSMPCDSIIAVYAAGKCQ